MYYFLRFGLSVRSIESIEASLKVAGVDHLDILPDISTDHAVRRSVICQSHIRK